MSQKKAKDITISRAVAADPVFATRRILDQRHPSADALTMHVSEYPTGVAITAVDMDGRLLGEVLLDYFDNMLRAHVYHADHDDPVVSNMIQVDVGAALRADHKPRET
jgi:hypothetical protein